MSLLSSLTSPRGLLCGDPIYSNPLETIQTSSENVTFSMKSSNYLHVLNTTYGILNWYTSILKDISAFHGTTDPPVMQCLWCLPCFSKPIWVPHLYAYCLQMMGYLDSPLNVIPDNLSAESLTHVLFPTAMRLIPMRQWLALWPTELSGPGFVNTVFGQIVWVDHSWLLPVKSWSLSSWQT